MTSAISPEIYKIGLIANSKIHVHETSPVYRLFYERREVAKEILKTELIEDNLEHALYVLESYNEYIKKYLGL